MQLKISNKIIGYLLLAFGIFAIAFSALNVYDVFKGKAKPFALFKFDPIALDFSKFVEETPQNPSVKQELIASDLLSQPVNYIAHLLLMGFIASAGFKIASLGIMLVRTIKVNLKEEKENIVMSSAPNKPTWK